MNFSEYLTAHLATPFAWGSHDCVTFALGWVTLATGRTFEKYGQWDDEEGATEAISQAGGLKHAFDIEFTPIDHHLARDGDLAMIRRTIYLFSGARLVGTGIGTMVWSAFTVGSRLRICFRYSSAT